MYVIENALINVVKNKGRNILLGGIIFAIIVAAVIAVAIYNTSTAIIDDYKTRFDSEVMIAPKMGQPMGSNTNNNILGDGITPEQTLSFAQSEYLKSADLTNSLVCYSDTLQAINQNNDSTRGTSVSGGRGNLGGDLTNAIMRLRGGVFDEFNDGSRKLTDGSKIPTSIGECIVSSDFADLNELIIGDTINLTARLFNAENEAKTVDISLKIVGTYHDATDEYNGAGGKNAYQNRRNEILTTFDTVLNAQSEGLSGVSISAAYYLKSPALLPEFEAEIRAKGLPDSYTVSTDEAGYRRMITPVEGLKDISMTFLIIILILGAAIMILLSIIAIRERKYEIGVLRAMGMKKEKIALGLWVEIIAVTCICFVIGMSVGTVLSQSVSDMLLTGQVQAAASSTNPYSSMAEQLLDEVNISVDIVTALEIFGISILLGSIASIISVSQITKYEPIKILMDRN